MWPVHNKRRYMTQQCDRLGNNQWMEIIEIPAHDNWSLILLILTFVTAKSSNQSEK